MVFISAKKIIFILPLLFLLAASVATAQTKPAQKPAQQGAQQSSQKLSISGQDVHISCNRNLRDMKNNRVECFGNVYIKRPAELLTADYVLLDMKNDKLFAEGNVVYFTQSMVIYGSKMEYNFTTGTGMLEDGRIESERYQLMGEKIEKLGENHYRAWDGEYTTCRDCPASWKVAGDKIDLTVEQYAFLNRVYIKINDANTLFIPYAIIPVKSKRQSGLLFPKWQLISPNGLTLLQPFYWAISRSTDATLSAGYYSLAGAKGEGEFRYTVSPRSSGQLNAFYLRDRRFLDDYQNRWAINYRHNLVFPLELENKMSWLDASDRDYVRHVPGDIPGRGEQGLLSTGSISRTGRVAGGWLHAKRIRNNLTTKQVGFDPNTVQVLPGFSLASTDHRLHEAFPLHWGIQGHYTRFFRIAPSYDPIFPKDFNPASGDQFIPGQTPLRRGQRFMLTPELYFPARFGNTLEWLPSVQYRSYFYTFDRNVAGSTSRGFLVAQSEFATTVESVYSGKVKHKFRPSLLYSNIPFIQEQKEHPFVKQIKKGGNQFDEFDIVPVTNETQLYFVPLGNSLTYRLGNKFILKSEEPPYSYKKVVDLAAGQSINFVEYRKARGSRQPLSRYYTILTADLEKVQSTSEYYYYPHQKASTYNVNVTYVFQNYMYRLLTYRRSLSLNYNYNQITTHNHSVGGGFYFSFNDFLATQGGLSYAFPQSHHGAVSAGRVMSMNLGFTYQSLSQCYKIIVMASRTVDNPSPSVSVNVPINLTGDGFMEFN